MTSKRNTEARDNDPTRRPRDPKRDPRRRAADRDRKAQRAAKRTIQGRA